MTASFPCPVDEHVSLASLTTFEVGGPARYLARWSRVETLIALLEAARAQGVATLVLGGGSNVLVSDRGFDGLVLLCEDDRLRFRPAGQVMRVEASAGVTWDRLVAESVARGLGGVECLSGIPGRVGAAPIQNIGAYGQELGETLHSVEVVERATGARTTLGRDACGLGYRRSHFKRRWRDRFVVVGVTLTLRPTAVGAVRYAGLEEALGGDPSPTPEAVRRAVLATRRAKSMVWDPDDPNRRSAGSFFVNPVLDEAQVREVSDRAAAHDVVRPLPRHPAPGGKVKIPAAWLIEAAGFTRGTVRGRVGLSSRHTLALINRGGAEADELVAFAREIRRGVEQRFGVTLEPEPVWVGTEGDLGTRLG